MWLGCGLTYRVYPGSVGDALVEHFFGPEKDKRLTVEKFKVFHSQLLDEIMKLEVCACVYIRTYLRTYVYTMVTEGRTRNFDPLKIQ